MVMNGDIEALMILLVKVGGDDNEVCDDGDELGKGAEAENTGDDNGDFGDGSRGGCISKAWC